MKLIQSYKIYKSYRGEIGYLVSEFRDRQNRLYRREYHRETPILNTNDPYYEVYKDIRRNEGMATGQTIAKWLK